MDGSIICIVFITSALQPLAGFIASVLLLLLLLFIDLFI